MAGLSLSRAADFAASCKDHAFLASPRSRACHPASWAGHSVNVLLRVYAKCIEGQEEAARRRIEHALGLADIDT